MVIVSVSNEVKGVHLSLYAAMLRLFLKKLKKTKTSDSLHRQVQLPLSPVGVAPQGLPSEALPAALFALAAKRSTKGETSSRLPQVSPRNSGPVGAVRSSRKAEGYCSFEFRHASPLGSGWSLRAK